MESSGREWTGWRKLVAVAATSIVLATVGCAPNDEGNHLVFPIYDLFGEEQQVHDRLPAGVPALLTTVPSSSRYLGGVGIHYFYVALGLAGAPFCLVVTDIYRAQVLQQCGGSTFGGEFADGLRFEFGALWARGIPGAAGTYQLSNHVVIEVCDDSPDGFPAIVALLDREQVPSDIPSLYDGFYKEETMRLIGIDDDRFFYFGLSEWPGRQFCVLERDSDTLTGTCGSSDVLLQSGFESIVHFSAEGFSGEVPDGWRQLSDLLRVAELDQDGDWPLYP